MPIKSTCYEKYIRLLINPVFCNVNLHGQKVYKGRSVDFSHGKLKVHENKRFICHADGTPFFYLGDTAWELFLRLNEEEAEKYLENRRQKGHHHYTYDIFEKLISGDYDKNPVKPVINSEPCYEDHPVRSQPEGVSVFSERTSSASCCK